ncbi:MFS transporter [Bailinhaonella thermotolerans]|uniref:MFS transporter n=1 Tax=Bailinhaonella thermotolerans TaxID=1070861 RepID=A0A3A4AA68_9ACTN|nr:MFS transporter [Bailinhaonella thermotolerans]RJL22940.1 MFS transporter [Bailinhaonella thermotolerans]
MPRTNPGAGLRAFAVAEFRGLWAGALLSRAGDQLARVALTVLVYQRTGSAALTAAVYALTLVPALLGGPLLGWLADRHPRRELMIACDVTRTVLVALMVVPGMPLPVIGVLVFASHLLESPSKAARVALLPEVLPAPVYPAGVAINFFTSQLMTLAGFAAGGVVVALTGPLTSLAVDAATFAAAAALTALTVRRRPAAGRDGPGRSWWSSTTAGLRLIAGTPSLRSLLGLATLAAFHVIPEAIAVPYAHALGLGTAEAGVMMAAVPVGTLLGVVLLTTFVPERLRPRLMGPLALAACLPLVASLLRPGFAVVLVLWALMGVCTAYQVSANAEFVRLAPNEQRGQAVGLASSALVAVQGLGVLLGGALVEWAGPAGGLAIAGLLGVAASVPPAIGWSRARPPDHP